MNVYGALSTLPGAAGRQRPSIVVANVSYNQPLPASFAAPLYVVEPWLPEQYKTIAHWTAPSLPLVGGQPCLLIQGSDRQWNAFVFPAGQPSFT